MEIIFVSIDEKGYAKCETYDSFSEVPYEVSGYTEDLSEVRARGACVHRAELDNQPEYKGWLGPMWDGGRIRYENQKAYDIFST